MTSAQPTIATQHLHHLQPGAGRHGAAIVPGPRDFTTAAEAPMRSRA